MLAFFFLCVLSVNVVSLEASHGLLGVCHRSSGRHFVESMQSVAESLVAIVSSHLCPAKQFFPNRRDALALRSKIRKLVFLPLSLHFCSLLTYGAVVHGRWCCWLRVGAECCKYYSDTHHHSEGEHQCLPVKLSQSCAELFSLPNCGEKDSFLSLPRSQTDFRPIVGKLLSSAF